MYEVVELIVRAIVLECQGIVDALVYVRREVGLRRGDSESKAVIGAPRQLPVCQSRGPSPKRQHTQVEYGGVMPRAEGPTDNGTKRENELFRETGIGFGALFRKKCGGVQFA